MQEHKVVADWGVSSKVVAFSTTRKGGVSEGPYTSLNLGAHVGDDPLRVEKNRKLLLEQFPEYLQWQRIEQVHGTRVLTIEQAGEEQVADALITTRSNIVCCVQTADCLPLFVAALDGSEVAMIHAGWKGLAAGIVEIVIQAMSTPTERLAVFLGPAIGPCHFEVGAEVRARYLDAAQSQTAHEALSLCFHATSNAGKYLADLYGIAKLKLSDLGVQQVGGGDACTFCEKDRYFSYRRDGTTGRLLHAIYIEG